MIFQTSRRARSSRRALYAVAAVLAIAAIAALYEIVREAMDRRALAMPGRLVDVGGRGMYLRCTGSGSPTVVMLPGAGEISAAWGWIAPRVARETRVCVYDIAGRGWSDDPDSAQDANAIVADLHALLESAHVTGQFVLVGHSLGGLYALTFVARFPGQVAGVVLLDATHPDQYARLPGYPAVWNGYRRVSALFPSLARLAVGRIAYRSNFTGLPSPSREVERAFWSTARMARSQHDEWAAIPTTMKEARQLRTLGARPLVVVTAGRGAQEGWLPLQRELAALSTNSSHRVQPNAIHTSLTADEHESLASSRAIHDVVVSVRTGRRLGDRVIPQERAIASECRELTCAESKPTSIR